MVSVCLTSVLLRKILKNIWSFKYFTVSYLHYYHTIIQAVCVILGVKCSFHWSRHVVERCWYCIIQNKTRRILFWRDIFLGCLFSIDKYMERNLNTKVPSLFPVSIPCPIPCPIPKFAWKQSTLYPGSSHFYADKNQNGRTTVCHWKGSRRCVLVTWEILWFPKPS